MLRKAGSWQQRGQEGVNCFITALLRKDMDQNHSERAPNVKNPRSGPFCPELTPSRPLGALAVPPRGDPDVRRVETN